MELIYVLGAVGAAIAGFAAFGLGADRARGRAAPEDPAPGAGRVATRDAGGGGSAVSLSPPPPGIGPVAPPRTQDWSTALAPGCLRAGIQLTYALRWVAEESGGNPCAVGNPEERGPDGYPKEMGIAQLYNPDDLTVVDPPLSSYELRAYCMPGDWHTSMYRHRVVRGFSQDLLRQLTAQEIQRQADGQVGLIARCERTARADLVAIGAAGEPGWSRDRRSYWALVKLQHGDPVLSRQGLPAVRRKLGRPPRDWAEFAANLAAALPKYAGVAAVVLHNAEACARAFDEGGVA